jgi:hypothetical protein
VQPREGDGWAAVDGGAMSDRDLETLIVCSFRYSLGRQTYMPSEIQRIAQEHARVISTTMLEQFIGDISSAFNAGHLGMDCDVQGWLRFGCWCRCQVIERTGRVYRGAPR